MTRFTIQLQKIDNGFLLTTQGKVVERRAYVTEEEVNVAAASALASAFLQFEEPPEESRTVQTGRLKIS